MQSNKYKYTHSRKDEAVTINVHGRLATVLVHSSLHTHTYTYTHRVGSVAANPDNVEDGKETGGEHKVPRT